jgi:hypothetical protein
MGAVENINEVADLVKKFKDIALNAVVAPSSPNGSAPPRAT